MTINIGSVQTFAKVEQDKAQALKILEEAAEVFGVWQLWDEQEDEKTERRGFVNTSKILNECADVIQATCNLLAAYGIDDFTGFMESCRIRNAKRGRM